MLPTRPTSYRLDINGMPKRISQLATEPCAACGALDFANRKTCANCKHNRRCAQIRESQKRRRDKARTVEERLRISLPDRLADVARRWRASLFLPLLIVGFTKDGYRSSLMSIGRRGRPPRRKRRLMREVVVPNEVIEHFFPGLHVFGADYDPPVAFPSQPGVPPPTPPRGHVRTMAVIIPVLGWDVFPIAQRCEANHATIHLEFGVCKLMCDGDLITRTSGLCITPGCDKGSHSGLHLSWHPLVCVDDKYEHHVSALAENELAPDVRYRNRTIFPDRILPSHNRPIVARPEGAYRHMRYVALPQGGCLAIARSIPITKEDVERMCQGQRTADEIRLYTSSGRPRPRPRAQQKRSTR